MTSERQWFNCQSFMAETLSLRGSAVMYRGIREMGIKDEYIHSLWLTFVVFWGELQRKNGKIFFNGKILKYPDNYVSAKRIWNFGFFEKKMRETQKSFFHLFFHFYYSLSSSFFTWYHQ